MDEGEVYNVSKKIVGEMAKQVADNFKDEISALDGKIIVVQENQKLHQEKDDEAFKNIEIRGVKIDNVLPKIDEMYDSICGNPKLGMKGYNQRVKAVEDFAIDQDRRNNRFIGAMWIVGISGVSGWAGFIYEVVKSHIK